MPKIAFALVVAACVSGAWAATPGDGVAPIAVHRVVHLDDPAALAQLRAANPRHYAQAQKILADANHLCRPTAGEVEYAQSGAKDFSCIRSLLKTSNPAKREIRFRLDDTYYVALVALTDDPPRLVAAGPQR
jgi:hypothetical protein